MALIFRIHRISWITPLDLVKGYALFSLLKDLDGGGEIKRFVKKNRTALLKK